MDTVIVICISVSCPVSISPCHNQYATLMLRNNDNSHFIHLTFMLIKLTGFKNFGEELRTDATVLSN